MKRTKKLTSVEALTVRVASLEATANLAYVDGKHQPIPPPKPTPAQIASSLILQVKQQFGESKHEDKEVVGRLLESAANALSAA